jgi:DNA-binding protein H-NS
MTVLLACRRVLERAALAPEKLRRKLFSRSVKHYDSLSSVESWDYRGRLPSLINTLRLKIG